jgi:hypothetical protein
MTKITGILLLIVSLSRLNGQVSATQMTVPVAVLNKFNTEHPKARANWKTDEQTNYAASYIGSANLKHIIVYDLDGNVVSKDDELDSVVYPSSIISYSAKNYPGETYSVWLREDCEGKQLYYAKCRSTKIWFDKNGNYMQLESGAVMAR